MERGTKRKAVAVAEAEAESNLQVPVGFRFNPTDVELLTYYLSPMERGTKRKAVAVAEAEAESNLQVPVGFTFNPTDVELLTYYLSPMLRSENVPQGFIHQVNVYAFHPQKLKETYAPAIKSVWYFFTPREPKFPNGNRPNRCADNGYWKATGSCPKITHRGQVIGCKRSLVFHQLLGDSNHQKATKTNWIMHEYISYEQHFHDGCNKAQFDSWVLCRIIDHEKEKESVIDLDIAQGIEPSKQLVPLINHSVPAQTSSPYNIINSTTTTLSFFSNSPTDTDDCPYYDEPLDEHVANQLWDYHFMLSAPCDLPTDEPAPVPTSGPSDSFIPLVPPVIVPQDVMTIGSDGNQNHMPQPGAIEDHPISTPSWLRGSWEEFDDKCFDDLLYDLDY